MLSLLFGDSWDAHPNNARDARIGSLNTAPRAQHKKLTRHGSGHEALATSETALSHVDKVLRMSCWKQRYMKPWRADVTLRSRLANSW